MACGWTVAAAVVGRAQMRAALQNFARNPDLRLPRVEARLFPRAARVLWNATALGRIRFMLRCIPVGCPLPDVADHVVKAVAVGWKCRDRRGALVAVKPQVLVRKCSLPSVRHVAAAGRELVAPSEFRAIETAARGKLPLRLSRQILVGPLCIGERIAIGDMHNRMVAEPGDRAAPTVRPPPL